MEVSVIGIRGSLPFDKAVEHFTSKGGEVILLNPLYVYGKNHVLTAILHAERAFANSSNRSKNILTETIMYISGERQVSKALKRMKPSTDSVECVAVLFDIKDPELELLNVERDDSIIDGNEEKAKAIGINLSSGIEPEKLVLELVAMLDIEKI